MLSHCSMLSCLSHMLPRAFMNLQHMPARKQHMPAGYTRPLQPASQHSHAHARAQLRWASQEAGIDTAQAMVAMQIWSVQTALLLRSCRGHDGEVTDLAINLDSTMVASSSNDTTIRCWSLEACTLLMKSYLCTIHKQVKDGASMSHEMMFLTKARGDTALRQTSTLTLSWPTVDTMLPSQETQCLWQTQI